MFLARKTVCGVIFLAGSLGFILWSNTATAGQGTYEIKTMTVDGNQKDVAVFDLYMEPSSGNIFNSGDLDKIETALDEANKILWDATEGHFLVDNLYVVPGDRRSTDQFSDIVFDRGSGWSSVSPFLGDKGPGDALTQIYWVDEADNLSPGELAHEFVHYILTCGDGYTVRTGACSDKRGQGAEIIANRSEGMGACIETGDESPAESTLTQHSAGTTAGDTIGSEFCTNSNHDPVVGCDALDNTATTNQSYQSIKIQDAASKRSCWETVEVEWSHATAPSNAPKTDVPSGYESPDVIDLQARGNYVSLVLDRSGSMGWAVTGDYDEVCKDGKDNDDDGSTDENDCSIPRIKQLKAGARAFLRLAEHREGFNVGVLSFSSQPTVDQKFLKADSSNISTLENAVDGISPSKRTAIGDALMETRDMFGRAGLDGKENKWGILFSDGKHNAGEASPTEGANELGNAGIRMSTVGTGEATQQSTLIDIRRRTGANQAMMMEKQTDIIAAFAQQMARHLNAELHIPLLRWKLDRDNPPISTGSDGWFEEGFEKSDDGTSGGRKIDTTMFVPGEAKNLTVVVGGTLDKMPNGFGVELLFTSPGGTTYDTENAGSRLEIHRDSFFLTAWIKESDAGDWEIELRPADNAVEVQTGTMTVYSDAPPVRTGVDIEPRVLDSSSDSADLGAFSDYETQLRNYRNVSIAVEAPTGEFTRFSTEERWDGTIQNAIYSSDYRGAHRVHLLFETSEETRPDPGEPRSAGAPIQRDIQSMNYGEWDTLFLKNGDDPGFDFRSEEGL